MPGLDSDGDLWANIVVYSIPMEDQLRGNLGLFCTHFS